MVQKPSNAYVQFSKRLTTAVTIAWFIFRLLTLVAIVYRPEADSALVNLQKGADDVMMVAIGFYAGNSVAEKGIIGYFKARANDTQDEENDESVG